jgi:DNA-binding IscR family transcriptional regulator
MNSHEMVQQALQCLQDLDLHADVPQTSNDISRRQHLSMQVCRRILYRLAAAGIVQFETGGFVHLARALEELMPDEILDAVWVSADEVPAVQMLVGTLEDRQVRVMNAVLDLAHARPAAVQASAWC